jgi:hypothetical protein
MFSACSTRPVHGAAKYSSAWRAVFQPNVATLPVSLIPRVSSAPPMRRVRSAHSPWVSLVLPVADTVTSCLSANSRSARMWRCGSVSGKSCMSPSIERPPCLDLT